MRRTWLLLVALVVLGGKAFGRFHCNFAELLLPSRKGYQVVGHEWPTTAFTNQVMVNRVRKALLEADGLKDEPVIYQELREYTQELFPSGAHMLPSKSRGRLLRQLAAGPAKILEIGTFTGYSALCFAEAGAEVVTMERCPQQAQAARQFLRGAGAVGSQVLVLEGVAQELLPQLVMNQSMAKFDVIHLDASMKCYEKFLELVLEGDLMAEDGIILADNVLFRGMVAAVPEPCSGEKPQSQAEGQRFHEIAEKLHAFNVRFLDDDPRTEGLILDQDDGLAIIWRQR